LRSTINSWIYFIYIWPIFTRNFNQKKISFFPLILFCLGFSTVFVILGASASFLGQAFLQNSEILRISAGIIIIIFSLQLIGVINIPYLNFEKRFDARESRNILFPYVIGLAFGFGWTPCIGPILGSILALASIEETLSRAILLLSFYSLGLAIPFVLSGYLIQRFLLFSKNFKKNINIISKIGGAILLITGILILTNQLQAIGFYIIKIFPFMQNFG
jgi:cytochrome c-type biogenesis protein